MKCKKCFETDKKSLIEKLNSSFLAYVISLFMLVMCIVLQVKMLVLPSELLGKGLILSVALVGVEIYIAVLLNSLQNIDIQTQNEYKELTGEKYKLFSKNN